ncbi:cation-translocating P-type ATPase [Paenibacillus filicis]|uniref:P-type Cu(+) transporter n=1 Tax=Paenibacillus filicis TaxID=669464 RepID=A0ABU9DV43_9BACL
MNADLPHEKATLRIQGMTCSACATRIENGLSKLPGVASAFVNLPLEAAYLRYNSSQIEVAQITERIRQLGFAVALSEEGRSGELPAKQGGAADCRNRFLGSLLLTLPLLWPMLQHVPWTADWWVPSWVALPWTQLALATIIQLVWGLPFLEGAWRSLRRGAANMEVLIAIGTTAAYLYSHYLVFRPPVEGHPALYFETSAVLITVVWLGKWLEAHSRQRAQASMQHKRSLLPASACKEVNGEEEEIASALLRKGDVIVLSAGDTVPADALVVEGGGLADEASLNGESLPRELREGDRVWAGARVTSGMLKARVEQAGAQSSLGKVIRALEEAQGLKLSLQAHADRAAAWFVPIVLGLAAASALAWYVLGRPGDAGYALRVGIAVLVCACPCAVGMAAPLSVFIGSRRAAERGILFRSGAAMEALQRVDTMVLDKTGTLTQGIPVVTGWLRGPHAPGDLLRLVASVEQRCEHPIAGAFVREAGKQGIVLLPASEVEELPGLGVQGRVGERRVVVGSGRLMSQLGIRCPESDLLRQWEEQGRTVMHIAVEGAWVGAAAMADALRTDAASALRRLRKSGLRTVLATGDGSRAAWHAARLAGIGDIRSNCLPADKLAIVREWGERGHRVVMVGDGLNDAAAMAAAHSSIAVVNATEAAREAADVHVLRADFDAVREAVDISRQTVRNIKQNLGWAFAYNALILPLAVAGHIEPWAAGAAMTASSLTVTLNALRLHARLRTPRSNTERGEMSLVIQMGKHK